MNLSKITVIPPESQLNRNRQWGRLSRSSALDSLSAPCTLCPVANRHSWKRQRIRRSIGNCSPVECQCSRRSHRKCSASVPRIHCWLKRGIVIYSKKLSFHVQFTHFLPGCWPNWWETSVYPSLHVHSYPSLLSTHLALGEQSWRSAHSLATEFV